MLFVRAYRIAGYYLTLVFFGVGGLLLNAICLGAFWVTDTDRSQRFFQRLIHRHFRLFIWWMRLSRLCHISCDEDLAKLPRGLVIVANHPGLMDITYLLARVPEAICIFKPAIRRNPILGAAAARAGYVVSGNGFDAVRIATEKVAAGHTLVVFPEGTRTPAGCDLGPMRSGFAAIARHAHAPVQLVRIHCDSNVLSKNHVWWKPPALPVGIRIEVGPRLLPMEQASAAMLARAVERWFRGGTDAASGDPTPASKGVTAFRAPTP